MLYPPEIIAKYGLLQFCMQEIWYLVDVNRLRLGFGVLGGLLKAARLFNRSL